MKLKSENKIIGGLLTCSLILGLLLGFLIGSSYTLSHTIRLESFHDLPGIISIKGKAYVLTPVKLQVIATPLSEKGV